MSEEEKKAIKDFLELREIHSNDSMSVSYLSIYQNAVRKMLNLVEQQKKEIILLKIEKLKALKQYKECHLSQIPDTANIYHSMKLELEAIDEEISNLMKIWENH